MHGKRILHFVLAGFICLCSFLPGARAAQAAGENSATIAAVGDLMFMAAQNNAARVSGGHDYAPMFSAVAPIIKDADIAIGNLEAPVAPSVSVAVDGARFNAPEGAITSLKAAGFDYVSTANNHACDAGKGGLLQTLGLLHKHGMKHSGTNYTKDARRYALMEANGIKFGILSYTFAFSRMSAIPGNEQGWMINTINETKIQADIANAKKNGADIILVNMHWDSEYTRSTSASTRALADRILYYGADAIIGHHPHTLQPFERKTVTDQYGQKKPRFIAYSLGNFLSNIDRAYSIFTCILQLRFDKDKSGARLSEASYVPVLFYRNGSTYRLLPTTATLNNASLLNSLPGASGRLSAAHENIVGFLGKGAAYPTGWSMEETVAGKWVKQGGKWYYQKPDGKNHTGWLKYRGQWYYLQQSGAMKTGWFEIAASGSKPSQWYYFDGNGVMQTGWRKQGGSWYYLHGNGAMATGWAKTGSGWYYFYKTGAMATGWVKDHNRWYYLQASGAMKTGWLKQGANWYYLHGNGVMQTGWLRSGNGWYYLNKSGTMTTGWLQVSGKSGTQWYYLDGSGRMQTGWLKRGGNWYYLSGSGAMMTGWLKIGGQWYYCDGNGIMQVGWRKIGNTWYYFYSSGVMAANTSIGGYRLGASGAMQ